MWRFILFALVIICMAAQYPAYYIYTYAGAGYSPALNVPLSVSVSTKDDVYMTPLYGNQIYKKDANGYLTTFGTGTQGYSGDGGPATSAELSFPSSAVVAPNGDVYISDTGNYVVRLVSTTGIITTFAGTGTQGNTGDGGLAVNAQLNQPYTVAISNTGEVYISDNVASVIRKVSSNGIISRYAGNGTLAYGGDGGPAVNAAINNPYEIALSATGMLYIADSSNLRVRMVDTNGIITTVAGNGHFGYTGDGGPATSATLTLIQGVAVSGSGEVFIADTYNNVIRQIDTNGIISTIVGNGTAGYSGDNGPSRNAMLREPYGVTIAYTGEIYIADSGNNAIRYTQCNPGYTGYFCQLNICYNANQTSSDACSGHGTCEAPDSCVCYNGYDGIMCAGFLCNGKDVTNSAVCSGRGACVGSNNCTCNPGYSGNDCQNDSVKLLISWFVLCVLVAIVII